MPSRPPFALPLGAAFSLVLAACQLPPLREQDLHPSPEDAGASDGAPRGSRAADTALPIDAPPVDAAVADAPPADVADTDIATRVDADPPIRCTNLQECQTVASSCMTDPGPKITGQSYERCGEGDIRALNQVVLNLDGVRICTFGEIKGGYCLPVPAGRKSGAPGPAKLIVARKGYTLVGVRIDGGPYRPVDQILLDGPITRSMVIDVFMARPEGCAAAPPAAMSTCPAD